MFTRRKDPVDMNSFAPDMLVCGPPWTGTAPLATHLLAAAHSVSTISIRDAGARLTLKPHQVPTQEQLEGSANEMATLSKSPDDGGEAGPQAVALENDVTLFGLGIVPWVSFSVCLASDVMERHNYLRQYQCLQMSSSVGFY
jgi:hypothetical protein